MVDASLTDHNPRTLVQRWQMLRASRFGRNLGSLGGAQLAIRISRLAATVVLSRLLIPSDYGLAAVVLTVYEFIALFTRNGIAAKVVQARPDDLDVVAMTAYRMTWIVCVFLMLFQIAIAWPFAWFYHNTAIAFPIAAMGIIYLATPLSNMQAAFQQREGRLGRIALAGAVQLIVDNALTVIFAVMGFGLWAIILPKILVAPIWIVLVRYGHAWRPKAIPGTSPLKGWRDIARFSRSVMGVEALSTLQANMDNFLVGYFLGMHALGIYYFAFNGGLGITLGLINAAGVAVYPHLRDVGDNHKALWQRFVQTSKTLGLVVVPVILLQSFLAPIYVPLVFGPKWVEAVPALSLICLSALARPFANVCSQLLKVMGRPEIELRWQLATTAILAVALVVACQFNIIIVALVVFVVQTTMLTAFAWFAPKAILAPVSVPVFEGVRS